MGSKIIHTQIESTLRLKPHYSLESINSLAMIFFFPGLIGNSMNKKINEYFLIVRIRCGKVN